MDDVETVQGFSLSGSDVETTVALHRDSLHLQPFGFGMVQYE